MKLGKGPASPSRRVLLRAAGAGAASLASAGGIAQAAGNAENQPPNLPEWSRSLGPGVIEETYGTRSRHETAVRRYVPWLRICMASSRHPGCISNAIMAACRMWTLQIIG